MLIASGEVKGQPTLFIGLDKVNIERLQNDMPILKDVPGEDWALAGWSIVIMGSEDTARFIEQVRPERSHEWPEGA